MPSNKLRTQRRYREPAILEMSVPIGRYVITGPTGTRYEFNGMGDGCSVHPRDIPLLLSKKKTQGCCGSPVVARPIFKLVNGGLK